MAGDINLLPQRRENFLRSEKTLAGVRLAAALSLVLIICLAIILFVLRRSISSTTTKAQEATLHATLALGKDKAVRQLLLVDRLTHIQSILTNRSSIEAKMDTIQKQLNPSVKILTFSLDQKSFDMSISSASLDDIQSAIDNMTELLRAKKTFKKLTIDNVIADEKTGKFILVIKADML
ncbi:MAG TPA: hypothetical protein VFQ63_03350 [Patescibacteria group bacterium]|nr:hypothetical protein [Patescibacteria group bacterium]